MPSQLAVPNTQSGVPVRASYTLARVNVLMETANEVQKRMGLLDFNVELSSLAS